MFESYCFIHFKMQNGAFQVKFQEFGSRCIYVIKPRVLLNKEKNYFINRVYHILNTTGWNQIHEIWLEMLHLAF